MRQTDDFLAEFNPDAMEVDGSTVHGSTVPDETTLSRGASVGRYTILGQLGHGGMGEVYAAYDPRLDRRIALKVCSEGSNPSRAARDRLLREAQAAARLSHPNVVTVYDAGIYLGDIFVAMECVEGQTLGEWLRQTRDWREIVEIFIQAGRGLAAAHEAGLVHRDFKPDNVMIDQGGRARVLDFGLARQAADAGDRDRDELEQFDRVDALGKEITRAGHVVGTPHYMAPEHGKGVIDGRSDQFSFCVCLYRALTGKWPFRGETLSELRNNVLAGRVREPRRFGAPAWVFAVVRRGLRARAEERYPSMNALLGALRRASGPLRRRLLVPSVAAGVCVALIAGYAAMAGRDERTVCQGAERNLVGVWDDERKAIVRQAFLATGVSYAEETWKIAARRLDERASAWVTMHREACMATEAHREQPTHVLDLRMICLDDRLRELRALSDLFSAADRDVVKNAVGAASKLPGIDRCGDIRALSGPLEPLENPEIRRRIDGVRELLASARTLRAAGKYDDGLEVATRATAISATLGYRPIEAETLYWRGVLELESGDVTAAVESLAAAELAAHAGRHDEFAVRAAADMIFAVGYRQGKHDEAEEWAKRAFAMLERIGGNQALAANAHMNLAILRALQARFPEAQQNAERALELRQQVLGDEHPRTAAAHHNLAIMLKKQGDYPAALRTYEQALHILRVTLGAGHPEIAMTLNNMGVVYKEQRDYSSAAEHFRASRDIWERTLDANHPNIAAVLLNLGSMLEQTGEYGQAMEVLERAHAIKLARLGAEHPSVGMTLAAMANATRGLGQHERSLELGQRAVATVRAALGDTHPDVALSLLAVGETLRVMGRSEEACSTLEQALAIREAGLGRDHLEVAFALIELGRAQLDAFRETQAMATLRRARSIVGQRDDVPLQLAESQFLLARAMWQAGDDRPTARGLAQEALRAYEDAAERQPAGPAKEERRTIERWLATSAR